MMKNVDQAAYKAWVKKIEDQIGNTYVTCPDCNGTGEGICPHCGNDTECETCSGDRIVRPSELLDESFYLRVMTFEKSMLEHWIKGEPIPVKDDRGRVLAGNPLHEIEEEFGPKPASPWAGPLIALCVPATAEGSQE